MFLRQSTASQEALIGPFLDDTDGKTAETALTIANTDIKVWKHGATTEANKNSGGGTHIAGGRYSIVFDATDTDTLGNMEINIHVAGALPVRREFVVLPANVYDSLVLGTDKLDANAAEVSGSAAAADNLEVAFDTDFATNYDGTLNLYNVNASHIGGSAVTPGADDILYQGTAQAGTSTTITLDAGASSTTDLYKGLTVSLVDGTGAPQGNRRITAYNGTTKVATIDPPWATGAAPSSDTDFVLSSGGGFVSAEVALAVWGAVRASYATVGTFGHGVASVQGNIVGTVQGIAADGINILTFAAGTVSSIAGTVADSVLDEAMSGHTTAGSLGKYVADVLEDTGTTLDARIPAALVGGRMSSDVGSIAASTAAATNQSAAARTIHLGTVDSGTTTTVVDATLTQSGTDHWKGRVVIFLTGTLALQASRVTAFTPGSDTLTLDTLTGSPSNGDTYIIV
jgi:hypothetical protein